MSENILLELYLSYEEDESESSGSKLAEESLSRFKETILEE